PPRRSRSRFRWRLIVVLKKWLSHIAIVGLVCVVPARVDPASVSGSIQQPSKAVPLEVQYAYSARAGFDDPSYHFSRSENGFSSSAAGLTAEISSNGVTYRDGANAWSVSAAGLSRAADLGSRALTASANRVDRDLGQLTESVVAGPLGIQQLWTVPT